MPRLQLCVNKGFRQTPRVLEIIRELLRDVEGASEIITEVVESNPRTILPPYSDAPYLALYGEDAKRLNHICDILRPLEMDIEIHLTHQFRPKSKIQGLDDAINVMRIQEERGYKAYRKLTLGIITTAVSEHSFFQPGRAVLYRVDGDGSCIIELPMTPDMLQQQENTRSLLLTFNTTVGCPSHCVRKLPDCMWQ